MADGMLIYLVHDLDYHDLLLLHRRLRKMVSGRGMCQPFTKNKFRVTGTPQYDLYDNSGLSGFWRSVGRIVILVQQVTLRCHSRYSRVRPLHGAYPHTTYSRLRSHTYVSVAFLHCYVHMLSRP